MNKATVNSSVLYKELKFLMPLINKRNVLPILSGVLMKFDKDTLTVTGSNFETTVVLSIECNCSGSFSFIIDFAYILDICSKFSEPLSFAFKDGQVKMVCGESKYNAATIGEPEHYPTVPNEEPFFSVDVDGSFFFSLYNASLCANKDLVRPDMNTACIDFGKDKTTIIGTDALIAYKSDFQIKSARTTKALVQNSFVSMIKLFQDAKVSITDKFIVVEHKSSILYSRLQDAVYVPYELIMNDIVNFNATVSVSDLKMALSRIIITSNDTTNQCDFNFKKDKLEISSFNSEQGKEGSTVIGCDNTVDIESVSANSKHLLHLLGFIESGEIEFSVTAPNKTIYFRPVGHKDILCLIQPLFKNNITN